MTDAYIIEIADEPAGIVVRLEAERSFKFHASRSAFAQLDGQRFDSPGAAERALRAHSKRRQDIRGRAA